MVTVREIGGQHAVAFLTERWPALYQRDPEATAFQSARWLLAWAEQLPPAATPLVLVAQDLTSSPLAALALVYDCSNRVRTEIRPLSAPHSDYVRAVGPGSEDHAVAAVLAQRLDALSGECDDLVMEDLPATSCLGRHLAARRGWEHTTTPCAVIDLPVDYAGIPSRSTRREHMRRRRTWAAMADDGRVVYRRTRTTTQLLDTFPTLVQLHQRRWAGHCLQPEADLVAAEKRWTDVLRHCGANTAFIATIAVDGVVLAAQLCLYRGDRCYSLLHAMDPAHATLSPGHALSRHLLADLSKGGFAQVDLGRTVNTAGQAGYKAQYGARVGATITARFGSCRTTAKSSLAHETVQ